MNKHSSTPSCVVLFLKLNEHLISIYVFPWHFPINSTIRWCSKYELFLCKNITQQVIVFWQFQRIKPSLMQLPLFHCLQVITIFSYFQVRYFFLGFFYILLMSEVVRRVSMNITNKKKYFIIILLCYHCRYHVCKTFVSSYHTCHHSPRLIITKIICCCITDITSKTMVWRWSSEFVTFSIEISRKW